MTVYKAHTFPQLAGPAAWNVILGDPPSYPKLEGAYKADLVIVGGGFAGLSAARRYLQLNPSAKVIVLEAQGIADGSSGRNSGFMIDLPHDLSSDDYAGNGDDRAIIDLNRAAIKFGGESVAEYGIDPNYFDPVGKINGAASEAALSHNKSYAQHLTSLGEKSELLDQQQMRAITGSNHYLGGLFCPGTVMLQPAGYIRGLARGLSSQGVKIFEHSAVHLFEKIGSSWNVETRGGRVSTSQVILTVNGHLESFGFSKNRLMQVFLYAVMTPQLTPDQIVKLGGSGRWGVTPSDPMGTTVRRIDNAQGGNRIVTRTCATLKPNMKITAGHLARAKRVMQKKFDQRFPQLCGMQMEYAWAGHLCLTQNGVSVARKLDDGLFSGCVQNGLGTTRGTLTGIAAAELASGVKSQISSFFEHEAEPKLLPPQPFREVGANLILNYKEWRAKAD